MIYIPPGDYRLRTQVLIDISFLRIEGSGHGFTSSSIRFNVPDDEWPELHELWPGGSRILVDLPLAEARGRVRRGRLLRRADAGAHGSARSSSRTSASTGCTSPRTAPELPPENTYVNGKTGIYVASANDSFRINGMGFVYLEHALTIYNADALSIHDNFIAECGSCIELRGWGQASKITDNLIGAGFKGHSIYAENHGGLLITANNVFPGGEQRPPRRRHALKRHQQPSAFVLPRDGRSRPGTARRTSSPRITSCATMSPGHPSWASTTGSDDLVRPSPHQRTATTPSSATTSPRSSTHRASARRAPRRSSSG